MSTKMKTHIPQSIDHLIHGYVRNNKIKKKNCPLFINELIKSFHTAGREYFRQDLSRIGNIAIKNNTKSTLIENRSSIITGSICFNDHWLKCYNKIEWYLKFDKEDRTKLPGGLFVGLVDTTNIKNSSPRKKKKSLKDKFNGHYYLISFNQKYQNDYRMTHSQNSTRGQWCVSFNNFVHIKLDLRNKKNVKLHFAVCNSSMNDKFQICEFKRISIENQSLVIYCPGKDGKGLTIELLKFEAV